MLRWKWTQLETAAFISRSWGTMTGQGQDLGKAGKSPTCPVHNQMGSEDYLNMHADKHAVLACVALNESIQFSL